MTAPPDPTRPGGSWVLQGCLFGAVGLFVILLGTMIFLAYARFRAQTAPPATPEPEPVPAAPAAAGPAAGAGFTLLQHEPDGRWSFIATPRTDA